MSEINRELIVSATPGGVDMALLEDKELVELHREKLDQKFKVGDIYLGRVNRTVQGLNAAFVDVGYEKDAFLHYTDLSPNIKSVLKLTRQALEGKVSDPMLTDFQREKEIVKSGKITEVLSRRQNILVQVLKEPISTKGPRLTCEITLPGRYLVMMPFSEGVGVSKRIKSNEERKRLQRLIESIKPKEFSVVVRTVAEGRSVADLHEDMSGLVERWKQVLDNLKGAEPPKKIHGELKKTSSLLRDLLNDSFNSVVVDQPELAAEITGYVQQIAPDRKNLVKQQQPKTTLFDKFGITRQIKSLFGKTVTFSGGSYLVIEHTEALHVIDVNSGHKAGNKDDQETTALGVNMAAAKEVARQLRLRDIGGIIVIDFIDLKKSENRKQVYEYMKDLMKHDRARHTVLQLSKFGLMQITRERTRPQIDITTSEQCPTCAGTGRIEASILVVEEIEARVEELLQEGDKVNLYAHPYIHAYLTKGFLFKKRQFQWFKKYKKWIGIFPNDDYTLTEYHFFDQQGEEILG